MDTDGGTRGGGEILQYMGQDIEQVTEYIAMNNNLIGQYRAVTVVVMIIAGLLLFGMVYMILKTLKINTVFRGRGINNELNHMEEVRKRDESILRANRFIQKITDFIEKTPFSLNLYKKDYLNYNLVRADIRIPGKVRVMKAEEYNALVRFAQGIGILSGLIIMILINPILGFILAGCIIALGSTVPMQYMRGIVREKDLEIEENFADFYLMIHYVLIAKSKTPLTGIMKSYDKTTSSEEMHKFIDVCVQNFETYGEYDGPNRVQERFKEIPVVCKLMRLIRQNNEGADVEAELTGFRKELLEAKEYAIQVRQDKLVNRARASFNVLTIVLIQAVISAMAIYFDDLSVAQGLF